MIDFNFANKAKARIGLTKKEIGLIAKAAAKALKLKAMPVFSVTLLSDREIAKLNKAYRKKDKPTDILSFPSGDGEEDSGDIFLAPAYIARHLKKEKKPAKKWYTRLMIHGLLHLQGYDHEKEKDYREMFKLEQKIYNEFFPDEEID